MTWSSNCLFMFHHFLKTGFWRSEMSSTSTSSSSLDKHEPLFYPHQQAMLSW